MKQSNISFIGGGNMARSLIGGIVADGYNADKIQVSDPDEGTRAQLQSTFNVRATASNEEAARNAEIIILAVKPQVIHKVAIELASGITNKQVLIVSIAAGIRIADLKRWLGDQMAIVRAMPNTPALVKSGATALVANPQVSSVQRDQAESIMRAVGLTLWLDDESGMDAVTALSGSGPAYFFLVMEALEKAGRELGLPEETARLLTLQTAFGAAKMALESPEDAATLRARVTSPGGTTERAIEVLLQGNIHQLFAQALQAASQRSNELAQLLGAKNA